MTKEKSALERNSERLGIELCRVAAYLNICMNRSAQQLRCWVPSSLRSSSPGYAGSQAGKGETSHISPDPWNLERSKVQHVQIISVMLVRTIMILAFGKEWWRCCQFASDEFPVLLTNQSDQENTSFEEIPNCLWWDRVHQLLRAVLPGSRSLHRTPGLDKPEKGHVDEWVWQRGYRFLPDSNRVSEGYTPENLKGETVEIRNYM